MLAESADLVGETDLDSVKCIGGVLDHFGHCNPSFEDGATHSCVKFAEWSQTMGFLRPKNGVGWLKEVSNRASLAHELGVVADGKVRTGTAAACAFHDGDDHRLSRTGKHGAAQNDHMARPPLT